MIWNFALKCCGNCAFWALSGSGQSAWNRADDIAPVGINASSSDCRRNAPTVVPGQPAGVFPKIERTKWCGDWRRRPSPMASQTPKMRTGKSKI